ncbi:MAG: hypothetical protein PVG89_08175 [Gammaproteobacteria bacterium]|jgi:hypothetical protein
MANHFVSEKVQVDVYERNRKYFANVGWHQSRHSLGPADTRDEIYQLVYGFLSDLKLMKELNQTPTPCR